MACGRASNAQTDALQLDIFLKARVPHDGPQACLGPPCTGVRGVCEAPMLMASAATPILVTTEGVTSPKRLWVWLCVKYVVSQPQTRA